MFTILPILFVFALFVAIAWIPQSYLEKKNAREDAEFDKYVMESLLLANK